MKFTALLRVAAVALFAMASTAFAQERGTAAEAKAMLEQAVAYVKTVGPEKAFADFDSSSKWRNKDLYVFVLKFDGEILAHGANNRLIGKNLIGVKDQSGKYFTKEMIELAETKGSGSVDYSFTDPETKKFANKTSFVQRIPGYDEMAGVGIYRN